MQKAVKDSRGLPMPLVVHVGYSKVMSSWLQKIFSAHPAISYLEKSKYLLGNHQGNGDPVLGYASLYQIKKETSVFLESDEHLILPGVHPVYPVSITNLDLVGNLIERMLDIVPNSKIVIAIRNQVDMLESRYIQYVRGQGGCMTSGEFLEEFVFHGRYEKYMDYRYSLVLDRLDQAYGANNVLLLVQEQMKSEPERMLSDLARFIGIQDITDYIPASRVNASPSGLVLAIERLVNKTFMLGKNNSVNTYRHITAFIQRCYH